MEAGTGLALWEVLMARTVGIGLQDFGAVIRKNCFYIDKTDII